MCVHKKKKKKKLPNILQLQWHPQDLTTILRYFFRITFELSSKYSTDIAFSLVGAQQGFGTLSGNMRWTWMEDQQNEISFCWNITKYTQHVTDIRVHCRFIFLSLHLPEFAQLHDLLHSYVHWVGMSILHHSKMLHSPQVQLSSPWKSKGGETER